MPFRSRFDFYDKMKNETSRGDFVKKNVIFVTSLKIITLEPIYIIIYKEIWEKQNESLFVWYLGVFMQKQVCLR